MLLAESTRLLFTRLSSSRKEASVRYYTRSASNLGYDYRYLPQILHATNRSLRGEVTEFFPTRLCLLRLKDTLHLSSVLRLTLDTRSLIHSDDGLNDAIRSRNDGRLCEEE